MASYKTMVEKLLNIATEIAKERDTNITEDILREASICIQNNGNNKQEVPKGVISQSEASRKYKIPQPTISRWTAKGYIPIRLRTNKEVYIDESVLIEKVNKYRQDPGQGKQTIKNC